MQTPRRTSLAVADPWSHLRLWVVVGGGVAADLLSKSLLWRYLGGPPETGGRVVDLVPGWLRLVASRNPGIVFGIDLNAWFGLGPASGQVLTIALTVLTAGLILYVFAASQRSHRWTHAWCGLILAGAVGNLCDRVAFGHVRDLFQFTATVGDRPLWPFVFNAADVFLVVGVALLALAILRAPRRADEQAASDAQEKPDREHTRP